MDIAHYGICVICDEVIIDTLSYPNGLHLMKSKFRVDVNPANNLVSIHDLTDGWIYCYRYNDIIKLKMHEIEVMPDQKEGD